MIRSEDFTTTLRSGNRSGTRRLVIHYRAGDPDSHSPAVVGVVVPKKQVQRAPHRNRIKRRIRAIMTERIHELDSGSAVVIRGLADADGAPSSVLAHDIDSCLRRCRDKDNA
ncbi:ribonuclease P protein component [Actinomyces vulturis]|uniref:ribonuclease P protein component n=1 Tax=Actinomyces vulturis TaxID=1857645 RepID=UPI0009F532E7